METATVSTVSGIARVGLVVASLAGSCPLLSACGSSDHDGSTTGGSPQLSACTADDPFSCEADTATWATTLEWRSFDGTGNNLTNAAWGSAPQPLRRKTTVAYGDGISTPARAGDLSARAISFAVCSQTGVIPNAAGASDYLWQWGQFIDHDLTLTTVAGATPEPFPIAIPSGDPSFNPTGTGTQTMPFTRSAYMAGSIPRQQINRNTAFVDASMVYGSDSARAAALRANDGTGRLLTTPGNLLPYNTTGLPQVTNPNDPNQTGLFVGGDERVNEQVGLTAMHTLWMREHNRLAGLLHTQLPSLTDEEVFQLSRAVISAEVEHITYDVFLPLLLGSTAILPYAGYQSAVDPSIENLFTIIYRVGHTLLSPELQMVGPDLTSIATGPMSLSDAFFKPDFMVQGAGIEPVLRGLSMQRAQEIDTLVVGQVQNFLFGPPGAGGLDLVSLNIQRGRDHGLPSYNRARQDYGLPAVSGFSGITANQGVQLELASVYDTVDDIDPWVGAVAEDHLPGAMVGPLLSAVIYDQFERIRDGDRLWYENTLPPALVSWVKTQTLSMVIRRNTTIGDELADNVFIAPQ